MVKDIKKGGMDGLIGKSSSKKSSNILDYGKKQTNKVSVKTTPMNQTTKKSTTENFHGKIGSTVTATNPKQNKNNFATSASTNNDKKYSTNIFGEKAGSSKNHGLSTLVSQPTPVADKNYVSSYKDAKNKKSSITFGIIWLPTKRRNKLKDNLKNVDGRDRSKERTPSMYNLISDRPIDKIETSKERDLFPSGTLKMAPPVYFRENNSEQSLGLNHLYHEKYDDQHEREGNEAGVSNTSVNGAKEDISNEETNTNNNPQCKGEDVVDKVNMMRRQSLSKEQTPDSGTEKEECIVVWLHYMLQCSDCCIM
ncbi:hypothetical protein RR46_06907 [Papilio xuthus]|uniref:Uncharacterized protein n=1 Tax=Papilio xuthus TaxID=66420 RepID=A0A194PT78_PAPXU|nr:hypothetical protein RR46_06907 [Papilio xuthus]